MILDAAAEVISDVGFGRASIEAISKRSGVARSTIYRDWPKREDLLLESVGERIGPMKIADTGHFRADLIASFEVVPISASRLLKRCLSSG